METLMQKQSLKEPCSNCQGAHITALAGEVLGRHAFAMLAAGGRGGLTNAVISQRPIAVH